MFKELCLVIPVKNRHYNLLNVMNYYKDMDCRKIIVDSSDVVYPHSNLLKMHGFDYKKYDPKIPYFDIILDAISDVSEKYILQCDDDDRFVYPLHENTIERLNKDPNVIAATGHFLYGTSYEDLRVKYYGSSKNSECATMMDNAYDRINNFFTQYYYCLCHIIIERDTYEHIFTDLQSGPAKNCLHLYDRMFSLLLLMRGKILHTDTVLVVREDCNKRRAAVIPSEIQVWNRGRNLKDGKTQEEISDWIIENFYEHFPNIKKSSIVDVFRKHYSSSIYNPSTQCSSMAKPWTLEEINLDSAAKNELKIACDYIYYKQD